MLFAKVVLIIAIVAVIVGSLIFRVSRSLRARRERSAELTTNRQRPTI